MAEAVSAMVEKDNSAVAVIQAGQLKGIVTRTDVLKALHPTRLPEHQPLSGIMTKRLVVAGPEQSFRQALERMAHSNVEHLPVVHEQRLLTVVHQRDLLKHQIDAMDADIAYLQEYIEGLHNAEQD
jgi:CBS domain-containing protein